MYQMMYVCVYPRMYVCEGCNCYLTPRQPCPRLRGRPPRCLDRSLEQSDKDSQTVGQSGQVQTQTDRRMDRQSDRNTYIHTYIQTGQAKSRGDDKDWSEIRVRARSLEQAGRSSPRQG